VPLRNLDKLHPQVEEHLIQQALFFAGEVSLGFVL
jgi:hypothetical protein